MQFAPSTRTGYKPFGPEDHYCDEKDPKNQVTNITEGETWKNVGNSIVNYKKRIARISSQTVELREKKLVDRVDSERSNDYTRDTAYATDDHHGQEDDRVT